MAYDEQLADRVRALLTSSAGFSERKIASLLAGSVLPPIAGDPWRSKVSRTLDQGVSHATRTSRDL